MLALATAPRYRSPWDCSQDKLPPVSLEDLLLEIEASGRPAHRQATIRKAMGLPLTNPALERKLKEMEFWPADARPLDFDVADVIYMLPRPERATVYGLCLNIHRQAIGKALGIGPAMVYVYRDYAKRHLRTMAGFFSERDGGDDLIHARDIIEALGYPGNYSKSWIADNLQLPWPGIARSEFKTAWLQLPRCEDLPIDYLHQLGGHATADTRRTYFPVHLLSEPQRPVAPGPEWLTEDQATAYLGARPGEVNKAVEKHRLTPHLIPFYKGTWFNRADLDAYAASFYAT